MRPDMAQFERMAPLLAWSAAAATLTAAGAGAALAAAAAASEVHWKPLIVSAVLAIPGALIAAGRPRIAVGWLILGMASLFAGNGLAREAVDFAVGIGAGGAPWVDWALWLSDRFAAYIVPLTLLALLLLPDGALPSRRWRPVAATAVGAQTLLVTAWVLVGGPVVLPGSGYPDEVASLPNPAGILPESLAPFVTLLELPLLTLPFALVPVVIGVRIRRSRGPERRRILSVPLAAAVLALIALFGMALLPAIREVVEIGGALLFAAVLTAAVLRRQLDKVDVVVHSAVVFTVLTIVIAGAYALLVTSATQLGAGLTPLGAGIVAAVIALAVLPLRTRLQRLVGRLLYGARDEPYEALRRLADTAHRATTIEETLRELAETIATSLRVPWCEVRAGDRVAAHGTRPANATEASTPLPWQGADTGRVTVAAGPGRALTGRDMALLTALARHGGVAVRAMLLAEAVTLSRQQVVTAREEERRSLARDLHDELGPTLASLTLQLGTLRRIVRSDPGTAERRLAHLEDVSSETLQSVRQLARNLRPPLLNDLGLGTALSRASAGLGLDVDIRMDGLPELPAAVELAAYRIGTEALLNAARHSGADRAEVTASVIDHALVLTVRDRGTGVRDGASTGVGIAGMRERAEELGGSLVVASDPGGTTVTAALPLALTAAEVRA